MQAVTAVGLTPRALKERPKNDPTNFKAEELLASRQSLPGETKIVPES